MVTLNQDGRPRKPHDRRKLIHDLLAVELGGRVCRACKDSLTPESFALTHGDKRSTQCRDCWRDYREANFPRIQKKNRELYERDGDRIKARALKWKEANLELSIWLGCRRRSLAYGIPFSITVEDIVIPERCPVFGFVLDRSRNKKRLLKSPSIDRIVPELGYVPGNIQIISQKANSLKWKRTPEELEPFARWIISLAERRREVRGTT